VERSRVMQLAIVQKVGLGNYASSFLYYAMPAIPGNVHVIIMLPEEALLCWPYAQIIM